MTSFPSPFSLSQSQCESMSPSPRQECRAGKHSVGWSKWKIGRDANTHCDSQALYTHRGTHTALGRKIAFGTLKAADVCLSFLVLPKTLLFLSLLVPYHCSLPLLFFLPFSFFVIPYQGRRKRVIEGGKCSSFLCGLRTSLCLFHQLPISISICIPRTTFASKLNSIKESSQGNLLIRAHWEENPKQTMM